MPNTYDQSNPAEKKRIEHYEAWGEDATDEEKQQAESERRISIVQALGATLLDKRKEAMEARTQCGIEDDWREDEEYYQSIDVVNPEGETNVGKPASSEGGPIGMLERTKAANRSTIFIPLTRPYVDAAHARVSDMLLPTDEWPFDFKPTVITTSEMLKATPVAAAAAQAMGMASPTAPAADSGPAATPAMPGAGGAMGAPGPMGVAGPGAAMSAAGAAQQSPIDPADSNDKTPDEIACDKAKEHITDWLTECQFHGEYRKMLENCAKLGTGVLKGPVPFIRVSQKMVTGPDGKKTLQRFEEAVPISVSIDPRNFYPDPSCGEDVQRGSYVWEFDTLSGRAVQDLLMDDSYIESQLRKVIREGPLPFGERPSDSPQVATAMRTNIMGKAFGIWYFHGMVDRESLIASGLEEGDIPEDLDSVPAVVTIINDTVVKCALSAMDAGGFPYDLMPWQRRAGLVWGMGVARQMRTPQRMLNGAARAMMDNAAFTSGPMVGIREEWIKPVGGSREIKPRMMFMMTKSAPDNAKIQDALSFTNITAAQAEMQAIMELAIRMAETATGLPMILQGQQGEVEETATGRTIQNNNGSTVLRRIARQSDDFVMERHIRRYYQWLLENTDYDDAKGDLQIDCSASTALVDRELSNATLIQLAPLLMQDPAVDKTKLNKEMLRAHRFDPKRIYKDDAQLRKDAQNPPPPPEKVQIEQMRQQGEDKRHEQELVLKAHEGQENRAILVASLEKDVNTMLADIAAGRESDDKNIKARLAETFAKLKVQSADMAAERQHDTAVTALVEPAGRAQPGHAETQ